MIHRMFLASLFGMLPAQAANFAQLIDDPFTGALFGQLTGDRRLQPSTHGCLAISPARGSQLRLERLTVSCSR